MAFSSQPSRESSGPVRCSAGSKMKPPVTASKSGPGLIELAKALDRIKHSDVLVGIPAEKTQRRKETINNASLLFVHTHGSPLRGIPPRPVLEPAIPANKALINPHMAKAAAAMQKGDPNTAERELRLAGTAAANAAKRWFTDPRNNWAPNAPSTIKAKKSDQPLIDTGQLRRAITFVVRTGK